MYNMFSRCNLKKLVSCRFAFRNLTRNISLTKGLMPSSTPPTVNHNTHSINILPENPFHMQTDLPMLFPQVPYQDIKNTIILYWTSLVLVVGLDLSLKLSRRVCYEALISKAEYDAACSRYIMERMIMEKEYQQKMTNMEKEHKTTEEKMREQFRIHQKDYEEEIRFLRCSSRGQVQAVTLSYNALKLSSNEELSKLKTDYLLLKMELHKTRHDWEAKYAQQVEVSTLMDEHLKKTHKLELKMKDKEIHELKQKLMNNKGNEVESS